MADSFYFTPKTYPNPVITKADNHPVYVNGTELINGMLFLSGNKTDSSRVEELKRLHFSADAIKMYTDSEFLSYYFKGSKGSPCNYGSTLPYKPSYSKISNEVILMDPDNYLVKHKIEITPFMDVLFNGALIATSPKLKKNAKGKDINRTQAEKLKFCRAVIWSIIPSEIRVYQKDSNGKMGTQTIPDDAELRRYVALYPALIDNQICDDVKEELADMAAIKALRSAPEVIAVSAPIVTVDLPERLSAYTHEGITGYPLVIDDSDLTSNEAMADLLTNGMFDLGESMISNMAGDAGSDEREIYEILNPVFISAPVIVHNPAAVIRSWMHGRMMISEEVRA
jgi:hypothetical protein